MAFKDRDLKLLKASAISAVILIAAAFIAFSGFWRARSPELGSPPVAQSAPVITIAETLLPPQSSATQSVALTMTYARWRTSQRSKADEFPRLAIDPDCWKKIDEQALRTDFLQKNEKEISKIAGSWFYGKIPGVLPEDQPSKEGRFFLGLARGGFIRRYAKERDDDKAIALLKKVADADASNSAPYLYAALIETRRGNAERAKTLIENARKALRFDSYLVNFSKTIFRLVKTPADLIQAYIAWGRISPMDISFYKFITQLPATGGLGRALVQRGAADKFSVDFEWVEDEYQMGQILLDRAEPKNELPKYRDLLAAEGRAPVSNARVVEALAQNCDAAVLAPMVKTLGTYFAGVPL